MKINDFLILFLMWFLCSSFSFNDDFFYYKKQEHKGIRKITENTHEKWKIISSFDTNGYLLSEINFHKEEIISDYEYNYIVTDSLLEIKRTDITSKDVDRQERIDQYYYTSSGQCYKRRVRLSGSDNPSYFYDNFVYENGMLTGYTEASSWQEINNMPIKIIYKYDDKKQKNKKMKIISEADTTFYSYVYNQSGQLTDYIQESGNSETVYGDAVVWSSKKANKIHIRYANFDRHGNWTKSYFITEKGKTLRSRRTIEYW